MNIFLIFISLVYLLSYRLVDSLSREDEPFTNQGEYRLPSHIIKLKRGSISDVAGDFEPTSFINRHYTAFMEKHSQLQSNTESSDFGRKYSGQAFSKPRAVKGVSIGDDFNTVVGQLDPYFAVYLGTLSDIEYIEANQRYSAPVIMPVDRTPKPYKPKHVKKHKKHHGKHHKKHHKKHRHKKFDRRSSLTRKIITQVDVPSWGLSRINHRNLGDLTTYTTDESSGNGVHVYILDSGLHSEHPDFGERAISEANFVFYEDGYDYSGHGTHIAGVIGGNSYGVAKSVVLHGIKILDGDGDGTTAGILQALSYVSKVAPRGRSIINLSLSGPPSPSLDEALSMMVHQRKIPVFVAAGNEADDACDHSPSLNPDVFTVGASDKNDRVAEFSAFGPCVQLYAPGTNITSSWQDDGSQTLDGTSMANPHVTGIAAILLSKNDYDHPFDLYEAVLAQSTPGVLHFSDNSESQIRLAFTSVENS